MLERREWQLHHAQARGLGQHVCERRLATAHRDRLAHRERAARGQVGLPEHGARFEVDQERAPPHDDGRPRLKNIVIPALEKAVNDMMAVLLEKAVKISVSTAEPIIKKDFALDPEENHMRIAARNMVANMSSGMMLITGKEPLGVHMFNTLKAQFTTPLTPEIALAYKDLINQACGVLVQDNIELCMCFLQKIAIQRFVKFSKI